MPNKKDPLPIETPEDVLAIDQLQALEYSQEHLDETNYKFRLVDFDMFVLGLANGRIHNPEMAKQFAKKLRKIDLEQDAATLGAELVRAFNLQKPEPGLRENHFFRDTDIAECVLVRGETKTSQAERHGLSTRQIYNIVEKYRDYIEANEKFFPRSK